jgi:hypothetical protein
MSDDEAERSPEELRGQVDLAQACAFLALTIAGAVVLSNFGQEPRALGAARAALAEHRKILEAHQQLLLANEEVLRQNKAALAAIRSAK